MSWTIDFHDDFVEEFEDLPEPARNELLAKLELLAEFGPHLSRPHVDTLNASKYPNMKEMRFNTSGAVWRVAFAFDPQRMAILLVAGNKAGQSEKMFYKQLIKKADIRFEQHLLKGDRK